MRARDAALVGLIHGPTELVPVSSSAHVALLTGREDRAIETAMHVGTAAALIVGGRCDLRPRHVRIHLIAGAIPSVAGMAMRERRGSLPAGLMAGALALAVADLAATARERCSRATARPRSAPTLVDAVLLGVAQACALVPGVSRSGATVSVARARGFDRPGAQRLSREIGLPVTIGAAAYTLARHPPGDVRPLAAGAAGSFLASLAALPLLEIVDRMPLWPFAGYRVVLALALMGRSAR